MQRFLGGGGVLLLLGLTMPPAGAQQAKTPDPPRPTAVFDPAAIRKQAAQMAEFRTMLSDPDPNVRLLTMREAMRSGDVAMREMATEAGLASNESAMISVALAGLLVNVQQIVFSVVDKEGKPTTTGFTSAVLAVDKFEVETGKMSGKCPVGTWSGQIQGVSFSFSSQDSRWRGNLLWAPETGDFRGRIGTEYGNAGSAVDVVWKVR